MFLKGKRCLVVITLSTITDLLPKQQSACEKRAALHRSSYVAEEDYYIDSKIICPNLREIIFSAMSILQCVHRCVNREECHIINYRKSTYEKSHSENCVIYDVQRSHENCRSFAAEGWVALVLPNESMSEEDNEESNAPIYKTCEEIHSSSETVESGVYNLVDGKHWCMMNDTPGCGVGGWTLAMTINGSKATFSADSPYWTNNDSYNTQNGIQSIYEEAKFPAFSLNAVNSLCVGMLRSGGADWVKVNATATSLRDLFVHERYIETSLGRDVWNTLLQQSSLQSNYSKEGFNVKDSADRVFTRLGIIANNDDDCGQPACFIAFGVQMSSPCSQLMPAISCGKNLPEHGGKTIPAMCYILIK